MPSSSLAASARTMAGNDLLLLVDKHWIVEAEPLDAGRNLSDLFLRMHPRIAGHCATKVFPKNEEKLPHGEFPTKVSEKREAACSTATAATKVSPAIMKVSEKVPPQRFPKKRSSCFVRYRRAYTPQARRSLDEDAEPGAKLSASHHRDFGSG